MPQERLLAIDPLPAELAGKRRVTYRRLPCRSVLNRNPNPAHGFYWSINPYRGCEIGCAYCYARYTHGFMELDDPFDFERIIFAKVNAAEVLARTVDPAELRGRPVAIGTATDPYQPAERRFEITRRVLEVLAHAPFLELSITTKSNLILRDLDLLTALARRRPLSVNVTITTVDAELARRLEPGAPTPELRLETLRTLRQAGIRAGVFAMPLMPRITDSEQSIDRLCAAAAAADARFIAARLLFLRDVARQRFFLLLDAHFPELRRWYERAYRHPNLAEAEARPIRERFARIRSHYRLEGMPRPSRSPRRSRQLELWRAPGPGGAPSAA